MSNLKDELWNIISGDFCYEKKICPKDDDGSEVSCEWCITEKVYEYLVKNHYGRMVIPDSKNVGGYRVHPMEEFEPITSEDK